MRVETKAAIALTIAAILLGAGSAAARNESVRWRQDAPAGIAGYELEWGTSSGSYGNVVDLSLPSTDASGIYSASVSVPDGATVYMALRAYDTSGQRSPLSNQIVRFDGGAPSPPPNPTPPPPDPTPPPPDPQLGAPGAPYLVFP